MTKNSDRRTKPRVEGKVLVKILADDQEFLIYTGNLSKTGMFLETPLYLGDIGEMLSLELSTPTLEKKLRLKGQIMRVAKANQVGKAQGIAVHFTKLDARHSKTFDQILDAMFIAKGLGCRKYSRAKTQLLIELKNNSQAIKAIAADVSQGGMFLETPTEGIQIGEVLNLIIAHPTSKRKLMTDAEVMHIRQGTSPIHKEFSEGLGVQFINLTPARQKDVTSFLRSILFTNRRAAR